MKKISKKTLCLVLLFTILMAIFMPSMVSALNYDLNDGTIINSYDISSEEVTLYVGDISVNGESRIRYLYTDKSVNENDITEINKILPSEYEKILYHSQISSGQIAISNDESLNVNEVYVDAGMVAVNLYPSGTVSDTSSTINYTESQFNNLVTSSATEISEEADAEANNLSGWNTRKAEWDANEQAKVDSDSSYTPVEFPEEYVNAFKDSTSYPGSKFFIADTLGEKSTGYIIRNGTIAQVDTYPIGRKIIKVVNTSANVDMDLPQITSADITIEAPKVGDLIREPKVTTTTEGLDVVGFWRDSYSATDTFEEGKDYYVSIECTALEEYELSSTFPDGVKVNGQAPEEVYETDEKGLYICVAKITPIKDEVTPIEEETVTNNPKTGDNIVMWVIIMIVSILGVVGIVKLINKR